MLIGISTIPNRALLNFDVGLDESSTDAISAFALTSALPGREGGADLGEQKLDVGDGPVKMFFGMKNTLLRSGQKRGGAVFSQRWQPEDQR